MRRDEQCRVRAANAGARARRFGAAEFRERAGRAGDVSDLCVWIGGAETALAAAAAIGRGDRVLRADRAGVRIESGGDADEGSEAGLVLGAEWREDVDHERVDCGCRGGVGSGGGWDSRVPSREGNCGIFDLDAAWEIVDAGVGDVEPG